MSYYPYLTATISALKGNVNENDAIANDELSYRRKIVVASLKSH